MVSARPGETWDGERCSHPQEKLLWPQDIEERVKMPLVLRYSLFVLCWGCIVEKWLGRRW